MTQFPIDVSSKLNAVQVQGYVRYLSQSGCHIGSRSCGCDEHSCQLLDELFGLLRQIEPNTENGGKELWLCARRGTLREFGELYGTYEEQLAEGTVENYDDYLAYWKSEFPEELMWYRLTAISNQTVDYRAVFLDHKKVLEADRRKKAGTPREVAPFVEWLVEAVRCALDAVRNGTYQSAVDCLLPYRYRVGTITRERLWRLHPEDRASFFLGLSQEEIDEFLAADPEHRAAGTAPLAVMTANDFYRFCSLGYLANGYACQGLTPKEQYRRFADGRDEGLQNLPPDDPEALAAWLEHRGRGGHPWEVCRGGSDTQISLSVKREPGQGYSLELWGSSVDRCVETIKFYLALKRAGAPVRLYDGRLLQERLLGKEKVGIVPQDVLPVSCESCFPGEKIIDFMHLSPNGAQQEIELAQWQPIKPVRLMEE